MNTSEASSLSESFQKLWPLTNGVPFHDMVYPTVKQPDKTLTSMKGREAYGTLCK